MLTNKPRSDKLHFFVTSLFRTNFFYDFEFHEDDSQNMKFNDTIDVRWWFPDILFHHNEPITMFELFRRRSFIGYDKFREKLLNIFVILPENFNEFERNPEISSSYGDKIVILTPKIAKLYYVISKVEEKCNFMGVKNVIILFLNRDNIAGELYNVKNREFEMLKRLEVNVPSTKNYKVEGKKVSQNGTVENEVKKNRKVDEKAAQNEKDNNDKAENDKMAQNANVENEKEKNKKIIENYKFEIEKIVGILNSRESPISSIIAFLDDVQIDICDLKFGESELYFVERNGISDEEIMLEGTKFRAVTDYEERFYNITDSSREMPKLNIVYKLLNDAPEYKPVSDALGIDLGTTRSAAAIHYNPIGESYLVSIPDRNESSHLVYSWVSFEQKQHIVGQKVFERFATKSKYTVYDVKRIIGRKFEEIEIDKKWPFKVLEEGGEIKIEVERNDEPGKTLYPEEVSAILLNYVKENAEVHTVQKVTQAVITVPAIFTKRQKCATQKAANLANIHVLHFLPEPTAAALFYCSIMEQRPKNGDNIFVFDLGGGTTDISIFTINGSRLIEKCQHGNMNLGGANFDDVLNEYFKAQLEDQNYDVSKSGKKYWLKTESSKAKEALTNHKKASILIDEDQIEVEVTRDEFEELSEPLLGKLEKCIFEALEKAKLKPEDIELVIKVGGSCIMPMIANLLEDIFPEKQKETDPALAVAKGAALYASSILPQQSSNAYIKNFWPL